MYSTYSTGIAALVIFGPEMIVFECFVTGMFLVRGRSFMTSGTLGGGGVNQILTFAEKGEEGPVKV